MNIGDTVKVFLKGESPWAIVTGLIDDTHMVAVIDNDLVNTGEHGVSFGDVESFELREVVKGHPSWEHRPTEPATPPAEPPKSGWPHVPPPTGE